MPTDAEHVELLDVEVPPDIARHAARMADEYDLAMEDALARLVAFDYPTDANR